MSLLKPKYILTVLGFIAFIVLVYNVTRYAGTWDGTKVLIFLGASVALSMAFACGLMMGQKSHYEHMLAAKERDIERLKAQVASYKNALTATIDREREQQDEQLGISARVMPRGNPEMPIYNTGGGRVVQAWNGFLGVLRVGDHRDADPRNMLPEPRTKTEEA